MKSTTRRVELYVRSLASRTGEGPQERAIDCLRQFDTGGFVDSFTIRVWGNQIGLTSTAVETDRGADILDRIGAFREWASRNDVSLEAFFDSRETESHLTGESHTSLRLPVLVMAEYEGDDVAYVTPHERDDTVHTVDDRLDELGEQDIDTTERQYATPPNLSYPIYTDRRNC
ncbi:MAG: hypothetical protein ACI8XM_002931 [Haloarculaceae archaeon]|jgi:hypothetical protein